LVAALALLVALQACRGFAGDDPPSARLDSGASTVTVSEGNSGQSIEIMRGVHVQVVLHSTYWQLKGSSDPSILAPEGSPRTQANRSECLPGVGCGTVTQSFLAVGSGRAELTAERTVCGEALACRPDQRRFTVSVVVRD
jgi:hypothetical protein